VAVNVGMDVEVWGLQATLQSIVEMTTGFLVRILSRGSPLQRPYFALFEDRVVMMLSPTER